MSELSLPNKPSGDSFELAAITPHQHIQNIGLVFNPISGRGIGQSRAESIAQLLDRDGFSPQLIQSQRCYDAQSIQSKLAAIDLAIVIGGDGTMMGLLPHLSKSRTPVYMAPTGNESLFSRAFKMTADYPHIAAAIRHGSLEEHSFGILNGRPFFTMASIGLDSMVVSDISLNRTGPIGHIGYFLPTLRRMLTYTPPEISLAVDGNEIVHKERGYLIVANSPEYALGLNLVPEANSKAPELAVRFFPKGDLFRLFTIAAGRLCGFESALQESIFTRGKHFEIKSSLPCPIQADGEAAGELPAILEAASENIRVLINARAQ